MNEVANEVMNEVSKNDEAIKAVANNGGKYGWIVAGAFAAGLALGKVVWPAIAKVRGKKNVEVEESEETEVT